MPGKPAPDCWKRSKLGSKLEFPVTLCNLSASGSSDVVEFGARRMGSATFGSPRPSPRGFAESENVCGSQEYSSASRDAGRTADEGAVFAILADSAQHTSLPRLSFLRCFRSRFLSTVTDFFRVGQRRIAARCLRRGAERQGQ